MDIEQVIGSLHTRVTPEEAGIVERMILEHSGTVRDKQLVEESALGFHNMRSV